MLLHRPAVAVPVEGQVVLGRHRLEHLRRHAVGLVQIGGLAAVDRRSGWPTSSRSKIRSMRARPASIVPKKLASSLRITSATRCVVSANSG